MTKKSNIRWAVFLIPWILVIATIILNLADGTAFNALIMTVTTFILEDFDWLFALMAFICVVLIVAAYFSPFGNVRIGGSKAKPILNQSNYIWDRTLHDHGCRNSPLGMCRTYVSLLRTSGFHRTTVTSCYHLPHERYFSGMDSYTYVYLWNACDPLCISLL